jgi:thiol-disulfide isomerase/thioredoxin
MVNISHKISDISSLNLLIQSKPALMIWFSHDDCSVCKSVLPKIHMMRDDCFPAIEIAYCDTLINPEIAAHYSIFTVPALLLYFEGREYIRTARNINTTQLQQQIDRPYSMFFDK